MKERGSLLDEDEMPAEFDFSKSIPNPWFVAIHGKKEPMRIPDDDPLDHAIDLSKSRLNPYWLGMVDRRCVRLLDSDLADAFPHDAAVNEALRTILRSNAVLAARASKPKKKARA